MATILTHTFDKIRTTYKNRHVQKVENTFAKINKELVNELVSHVEANPEATSYDIKIADKEVAEMFATYKEGSFETVHKSKAFQELHNFCRKNNFALEVAKDTFGINSFIRLHIADDEKVYSTSTFAHFNDEPKNKDNKNMPAKIKGKAKCHEVKRFETTGAVKI